MQQREVDEVVGVANPIMIKNGEREGGEQELKAEGSLHDSYITLRGALNEIELRNKFEGSAKAVSYELTMEDPAEQAEAEQGLEAE
eukprot:3284633-Alexandrium_andersonii.AAC.1